jgi:hypothetical protein
MSLKKEVLSDPALRYKGLGLKNPRDAEVGTIEWQDIMVHNIKVKTDKGIKLDPFDRIFK